MSELRGAFELHHHGGVAQSGVDFRPKVVRNRGQAIMALS